jgi:hypothetical protein
LRKTAPGEYSSTQYVEQVDPNLYVDRFDPMSVEHLSLSLQDILELEETGQLPAHEDEDARSILITIVRRALVRLPKVERMVIERYYMQGKTANEIAKGMGLVTEGAANNIRLRAIARFERLFYDEKRKSGVTADYNCCPICDCEHVDAVEERVHFWLDEHQHSLQGLPAELERQFDLRTDQQQIAEHIEYHMISVDDRVEIRPETKEAAEHTFSLSIPLEMKKQLEQIVFPYSVSYRDVVRWALKLGIPELQNIMRMNEQRREVQLQAARFFARVRRSG